MLNVQGSPGSAQKLNFRRLSSDEWVIALLLSISGNRAMWRFGEKPTLVVVVALLLVLLGWRRKLVLSHRFQLVLAGFVFIVAFQAILLGSLPAMTLLGFFTRLLIGYCAVALVADFPASYVKVLVWLAAVSLPLWAVNALTGGKLAILAAPVGQVVGISGCTHVLVHSFSDYSNRNMSMFWEPGAYAAYLELAIMLIPLVRDRLSRRQYRWSLILLSAAVVSTESTTGLVLLPVCLLWNVLLGRRAGVHKALTTVAALVLLGAGYAIMSDMETVGDKLRQQYEEALYREENYQLNRLGNLLADLEMIRVHPFVGWGPHPKAKAQFEGDDYARAQGNGLSGFVVKFGLAGLALYLGFLYAAARNLTQGRSALAVYFCLFVAMLLNGEALLNFPLFMGLMFMDWGVRARGVQPSWARPALGAGRLAEGWP